MRAARARRRRSAALVASAQPTDAHRAIAQQLSEGSRRLILLGALAQRDPAFADLRLVAGALAELTGATLGYLPEGGNAVGARLAGVLPHRARRRSRGAAGRPERRRHVRRATEELHPARRHRARARHRRRRRRCEALKAAEFVVALSPYCDGEGIRARDPADRHVRGDFRHVRESRRPLAERAGRGDAGRRVASGVEGAARARQSAEPARLRLHQLGSDHATKCARRSSDAGVRAQGRRRARCNRSSR